MLEAFVQEQEKTITTNLEDSAQGKVRIGTIQSFKG